MFITSTSLKNKINKPQLDAIAALIEGVWKDGSQTIINTATVARKLRIGIFVPHHHLIAIARSLDMCMEDLVIGWDNGKVQHQLTIKTNWLNYGLSEVNLELISQVI